MRELTFLRERMIQHQPGVPDRFVGDVLFVLLVSYQQDALFCYRQKILLFYFPTGQSTQSPFSYLLTYLIHNLDPRLDKLLYHSHVSCSLTIFGLEWVINVTPQPFISLQLSGLSVFLYELPRHLIESISIALTL